MTVIKRSRADSSVDLVTAIEDLIPLLQGQREHDAAYALKAAVEALRKSMPGTQPHKDAVEAIVDAFEGDHELMDYTIQRGNSASQWTEVEQLANASSRVISLARRML